MIALSCLQLRAQKAEYLDSLDALSPLQKADIRTLDDKTFEQVQILQVSIKSVFFEQDGARTEMPRYNVFRVLVDGRFYSDQKITATENAELSSAEDYLKSYADYVLLEDHSRYFGKIASVSESEITLETRGESHRFKIASINGYRKDRSFIWLAKTGMPPEWIARLGYIQVKTDRVFEGLIGISSPLNIFPQMTLGLQSNSSWPVFAGIRAGASGPILTAGWFYGQAQFYLGINFFQFRGIDTGLIAGYLYREHALILPLSCGQSGGNCGNIFTTLAISQKNFYLALSLRYRNVYFELGWELTDYFSNSFSADIKYATLTNESLTALEREASKSPGKAQGFADYSRLYFSMGFQFFGP